MASATLTELIEFAARLEEPQLIGKLGISTGSIDSLGLRQINFDLMDLVIPSLNNVARHIRPYTVIAWAWHRAAVCAKKAGHVKVDLNRLQDFVDRIEVIFAWSQFLRDSRVDLPGRDVLDDLVKGKEHVFGGKGWAVRREKRRDSTALSAAVNYGPFIKALGWIQPAPKWPGAFVSADKIKAAISALENRLGEHLEHPAFSKLGPVTVTAKEVKNWSKAFSLEFLSAQEK